MRREGVGAVDLRGERSDLAGGEFPHGGADGVGVLSGRKCVHRGPVTRLYGRVGRAGRSETRGVDGAWLSYMIVETIPPTVLLVIFASVAKPACRETGARPARV